MLRFTLVDERALAGLLDELASSRDPVLRPKADLWPDWNAWRNFAAAQPAGDQIAALWSSLALPCFWCS